MLEPKIVTEQRAQMSETMATENAKIHAILRDDKIPDEEADRAILAFNAKLDIEGLGSLRVCTRSQL